MPDHFTIRIQLQRDGKGEHAGGDVLEDCNRSFEGLAPSSHAFEIVKGALQRAGLPKASKS